MPFLDHLDDATREALNAASAVLSLEAGDWLVRSGDPGGDIYVVEEGTLDVVEARPGGEVVLATLAVGDIVGELAFLDDSPRSADVRCRLPVRARRWTREDLRHLLDDNSRIAARVYDALARTVANRLRNMAQAQQRSAATRVTSTGDAQLWQSAITSAGERVKSAMERAHLKVLRKKDDPEAVEIIREAFDILRQSLQDARPYRPGPATVAETMRGLRRELRPWLSGSWLAMRLVDAPATAIVQGDVFDHVLDGEPRGEGWIAPHIEHWLMNTATMVNRRETERAMVGRLAALQPRRVVWLDTPAPGRMKRVGIALRDSPTALVVVDGSRAALSEAHAALQRTGIPKVDTVQETPLRLALGRSEEHLPRQDVVVLGGLLAYLPDRLAVPILDLSRRLLRKGGHVLLDVPAEDAPDDALWSDLFRWPVIRRTDARLERLFARADLALVERVQGHGPGEALVLGARS